MSGGEHVVMIQCVILIRSLVITGHGQYQLQYQSNWIPSDKLWYYNRFIQFDQIHKSFRLCTKDVSNKQVDNVQRASKAVNPFHLESIYHDIVLLLLCWKINDKIIFRNLSTLQRLTFRQLPSVTSSDSKVLTQTISGGHKPSFLLILWNITDDRMKIN